jgi:hypothetical protein
MRIPEEPPERADLPELAVAAAHPAGAVPEAPHFPASRPEGPAAAPAPVFRVPAPVALKPGLPAISVSQPLVPRDSLRRIPVTLDPISTAAAGQGAWLDSLRLSAGSRVFDGLQQIKSHSQAIVASLTSKKLPAKLIGALRQPNGGAAALVQVELTPASVGGKGATITVLTAADGGFTLPLPVGARMPAEGLVLTVHGSDASAQLTVTADQIAANGVVRVQILPQQLAPLPVSIIAALAALAPTEPGPATAPAPATGTAPAKHRVTLGESNSLCQQTFAKGETTDRFPWGLFFRLVEPQLSIAAQTRPVPLSATGGSWLPVFVNEVTAAGSAQLEFIGRTPIDQPLSVDGFRDQLAGIDGTGYFTAEETVPMAASLGLGYVLRMAQQWKFNGLGLGDLIYSLPLAPGEQQQIAVFERQDTTSVSETESFSQDQSQQQTATADTSTSATFHQAFSEAARGSSDFSTSSGSSGVGLSFSIGPIGFGGGGGGSSSASGSSNSSLSGSRDVTSQATQATHSSAENTASGHLSAQRTGMRMASASENMGTTTTTITNHNHTRALTMQYWEVVRSYEVTTTIEGVTLVCLVPMQVVRFMPPAQPAQLTDPSMVDSPAKVAERYKNILRHLDVLEGAVPWQFRRGLEILGQFAADPTTIVAASGTAAATVIGISLAGSFLPCEQLYVSAVTKRGTRVGPVRLISAAAGQPLAIPPNKFMSHDELTGWLTAQRQASLVPLQASLAVPPSVNPSDIVGFELSRQFSTVMYTLTNPVQQAMQLLGTQNLADLAKSSGVAPLTTVTLGQGELEQLVGGPVLTSFSAVVRSADDSGQPAAQETYASGDLGSVVLPAQPFPVPARQVAPVLRYQDILQIERSAQHIVRNTARYSKAIWLSLTPDETAMLLDGHTIGVPADGLPDASQMIPLLNCLQNTILGTYGNSLIMPFVIPQELADLTGIEPDTLQETLLQYQREAFVSPQSTIALPTRGVVGEAVLGSCPSAEKIDITRFWNWQDAPADTAPGIGMVQLPTTTPPLTTGMTAPNSLTNLPPLINNLITAPQPNTGLLQAMGQQATSQPDFSPTLTGQQQLATVIGNAQTQAGQARAGALQTSQALATASMQSMTDLAKTALTAGNTNTGGNKNSGANATGAKNSGTNPCGTNTTGAKTSGANTTAAKKTTDTNTGGTNTGCQGQPATTTQQPATGTQPATSSASDSGDSSSAIASALPVVEEAAPLIAAALA